MKRYFLLKVLTFTSLPAWFGVLCFVHLFYWPYEGCNDPSDVLKTLVDYPGLLLPFVPLGVVLWRVVEICRGCVAKVAAVENWWRTLPTLMSMLFWGICAVTIVLDGSGTVRAICNQAEQDSATMREICLAVCACLAYVTPMVTTAYFVVLLFHRISDLRKRRKVADRT